MGTNYYWARKRCPTCRHADEEIHIGKSSGGWCFSLHVDPEYGITSLADWEKLFNEEGSSIRDEYGAAISVFEMMSIITERKWYRNFDEKDWKASGAYRDEADFHSKNHSFRGPNGLLRHQVNGWHCVGNGEGTWDYIKGNFS